MSTLLITKQTGNFFSLQLNSEEPIVSEQNRLTTVGDFCHFKTISGANIIKDQNIRYSDITLIASGSFTFASVNALRLKLIEVGFFDGLAAGGGGGGVDQFTELLDTFHSYIGRDGQALVVNESQLKIETVPFANVSAFTDLSDAPNPLLPNKMIVTNPTGTALIMTDLPEAPQQYLNSIGSFNYNDLATQTVPIAITAGVETKLTNDTLGDYTKIDNAPFGVSSMYNPIINAFDFSQLSIGDMVWFRTTFDIDLAGTNTSYKYVLKCAVGSGATEWELPIYNGERKSTDSFKESHEFSIVMDYQFTIDYPAELWITTDASASLKVDGSQIKVLRKNINIVLVANDDTKENVANKISVISGASEIEYPNEKAVVDYIASKIPTDYAVVVYINTTNPNTATIFDDVNPPLVNDPLLEDDTDNLYIGTDNSTWVYNGVTYVTKVILDTSNFNLYNTSIDAGNNKQSMVERFGAIVSKTGNIIRKNGSDSVLGGGYFSFYNNGITDGNTFQFNDSNGLDLWNLTSSVWTKINSFSSTGKITATAGTNPTDVVVKSQLDLKGDVAKVGTPVDNQIGVWTGNGTIEGDANLTWDGELLRVAGEIDIVHTATQSDDHALEIDVAAEGFGGVKAIDINYATGAIAPATDDGVILINIDESLSTGGEVFGVEVLTTDSGSAKVIALKTGVNIDPLSQDAGTFGNPTSVLNNEVDVLADILSNGGSGDIIMFTADNNALTIGLGTKFNEIEILMDIFSSQNINPVFDYSTGVGTWSPFSPTDGTNGFRNNGVILWDSADLSGWVAGTGGEFLIRITRTRNALTIAPRVDNIQVVNPIIYSWDKDGNVVVNSLELPDGDVQSQLDLKADLASPSLTGIPTAPTAAPATNTTQIATTAFVLANAGGGSGGGEVNYYVQLINGIPAGITDWYYSIIGSSTLFNTSTANASLSTQLTRQDMRSVFRAKANSKVYGIKIHSDSTRAVTYTFGIIKGKKTNGSYFYQNLLLNGAIVCEIAITFTGTQQIQNNYTYTIGSGINDITIAPDEEIFCLAKQDSSSLDYFPVVHLYIKEV